MTDTDTSGASAAPTADTSAPVAPAATAAAPSAGSTSQPFGTFGSTRGSGLARGKRPSTPTASNSAAAPVAGGDYKPSSLEVITTKSEYKNPFASEEPASAPVVIPANVETSAPIPAAAVPPPAAPAPAPVVLTPAAVPPPAAPATVAVTEKAELNILPPAEPQRPATSWETPTPDQRPRREERPTFRPEPREARRGESFQPREPRRDDRPEAREPRREEGRREDQSRGEQPRREPRGDSPREVRYELCERSFTPPVAEQPAAKSGGFFGWLKGLFGGKPETPAVAPASERSREGGGDRGRDGFEGGRRRNRRGGRGRYQGQGGSGGGDRQGFTPRGEGEGQSQSQGGEQHGGERRHEGQGGGQGEYRGRRSRGGRGRGGQGGDRGDRGGYNPRPEGQQGGGAI